MPKRALEGRYTKRRRPAKVPRNDDLSLQAEPVSDEPVTHAEPVSSDAINYDLLAVAILRQSKTLSQNKTNSSDTTMEILQPCVQNQDDTDAHAHSMARQQTTTSTVSDNQPQQNIVDLVSALLQQDGQDGSYCSFFFMKNITGSQIQYSVRMEKNEVCVCRNALKSSTCVDLSKAPNVLPHVHTTDSTYSTKYPTVTEQIPGDGIDNDGDGLVDEEYCGFLWEDDNISDIDLDGTMNEDCKGCKEGEELSPLFECKGCDYGKFREKASKIVFCQSCPKNQTTFDTRSNSSKDCVPICEEGTELNSMKETCEPCSIGFYKNVSANDISLNKTERFECKRCPGNLTTYSTKSTDISDCIEHCDSGQYLFQNNTCLPCEMKTYKNTSSQDVSLGEMLRWNCLHCKGQSTTISVGSKACIMPCSKGYQINRTSQKCEPCPLGFYKNVTGIHINCTQCPDNYTTRAPGKKSHNDCKKG
uniref:Sushi, von Willebrand factor type A, EGF and pentraxin domain-containing protein 1 n=1 Tax=Magallana gigas TaxID=29159 RepID=K1R124_MAGGI